MSELFFFYLLVENRSMHMHSGKIRKLSSKLSDNNFKSSNSSATKHRKCRLNMNVMLIIKYSSIVMQGKK